MELATQTVPVGISSSRPLANYKPSVWGDRFLLHKIQPNEASAKQLIEKLKEEVKRELKEVSNDYMRLIKMVDAIQRLGIEYQFKEEIDQALQNLSEKYDNYCKDSHDMYTIALSFRLLRQHGYRVSSNIFDRFKDEESSVPEIGKAMGMLEFFEATHLRVHDEEILDRGYVFSRSFLESVLPNLSNPLAEQVRHALYQNSNRRGLTRVEARHYISIYDQYPSHHEGLLRLAKLDFNLLQSMHKRELSELYRWWKSSEVPTKLTFARDRLVETYFWDSGVYFEPEYALARKFLVKLQCLMSVLDDTFDAYGTYEELSLFVEAIERWNLSCLDHLPDYMKILYKTLLDVFEEIEEEMIKQGTLYRLNYGIEVMKIVVRAFLKEAKWREEKYKPKSEEYMQIATYSCGYTALIIMSFLGMGDVVTKEAFDWVLTKPDAVRATLIICRLVDDIVGYEFEKEREHIPTAVDCYIEEHKVSMEDAINELNTRIESAWKDLNEVFMKPTKFPTSILYRILNFARVIEVMYTKGDWYTHVGPEMQSFIRQLLIDPVPIPE